jgi:hypothetical protein
MRRIVAEKLPHRSLKSLTNNYDTLKALVEEFSAAEVEQKSRQSRFSN